MEQYLRLLFTRTTRFVMLTILMLIREKSLAYTITSIQHENTIDSRLYNAKVTGT